ncbi:pheromone A receptor-domain-containing protein [Aspergillus pseudoustus]|uniref:Pheromone A receptor-domain-containing protein n=1 Tax=Aspergillus pseudoustus TaxID=1810923 RepID=A0ABR4J6C0_9EURO
MGVRMTPSAQTVAMQVLSFLALLISLPPLGLHWKNRNFPCVSLICWFLVLNVFNIVNAFIWATDDIDDWWDGEGLCDVEVKILTGSYVAVPGALVCIFRSLAFVLDTRRAALVPSKHQRRRDRAMELSFCVVIPLVACITHIIYQGNRYFIYAVSGCVTSLHQSWVSLALGYIWPLVICCIASYYCGLVIYRLHHYRNQFNKILRAANTRTNKSRFLRLFCLSLIMLLALIPIQTYMVYTTIRLGLPWHAYSWAAIHGSSWSVIGKIPTDGKVYFDRWVPVASGFMFFIFFGCGRDAHRMYLSLLSHVGLDGYFSPVLSTSSSGSFPRKPSKSGSQAQLLSLGTQGQSTRHDLYHTHTANAAFTPDLEKNRPSTMNTHTPTRPPKVHWLRRHLVWLSRPSNSPRRQAFRSRSTPNLAVLTNTVCTSAWAGSSQSRESMDSDSELEIDLSPVSRHRGTDFIRVKQVIRQEREVQV